MPLPLIAAAITAAGSYAAARELRPSDAPPAPVFEGAKGGANIFDPGASLGVGALRDQATTASARGGVLVKRLRTDFSAGGSVLDVLEVPKALPGDLIIPPFTPPEPIPVLESRITGPTGPRASMSQGQTIALVVGAVVLLIVLSGGF